MEPAMTAALLQAGLLLASAVVVQFAAVHYLAEDEIPAVLRSRVAWSNRVRPWVAGIAALLLAAGATLLALPP